MVVAEGQVHRTLGARLNHTMNPPKTPSSSACTIGRPRRMKLGFLEKRGIEVRFS